MSVKYKGCIGPNEFFKVESVTISKLKDVLSSFDISFSDNNDTSYLTPLTGAS